jgi:hypothetical protein
LRGSDALQTWLFDPGIACNRASRCASRGFARVWARLTLGFSVASLVSLRVRTATAFRWRPIVLAGQSADVVRIVEDGDAWLAVLANGYECGFSTCWPPASRLILDLFLEAWATSSGPVPDRLHAAFDGARKRFADEAATLITQDADFPDDLPSATLLAVANEGTTVHAAWIGGDTAMLARGFRVVGETTPHTMREQYKREHTNETTDLSAIPNVLLRTIGPRATEQDAPTFAAFEVEAGDTVILLSRAHFRGTCVPAGEAAFAAAVYACPEVLAARLGDLAFANEDSPYAAVAIIRFDAFDVGPEIDRLIDEFEPGRPRNS